MKKTLLITCSIILLVSCSNELDKKETIFPKGNKAAASNFTGTVWLHPVLANDSTFHLVMGSVTFEPSARSNWHNHPAGQILVITDGECYTQERGKQLQVYRKGDVVKCLPNVDHWHGASPQSSMTHIAVNPNTQNGIVNWLEPVTDEQYNSNQKR
jgi:quercetin dioxygenase-like cupin family protein